MIEDLTDTGEIKYQWTFGKPLKYRTLTDAIEVALSYIKISPTDVEGIRLRNVKTEESIPLVALGL